MSRDARCKSCNRFVAMMANGFAEILAKEAVADSLRQWLMITRAWRTMLTSAATNDAKQSHSYNQYSQAMPLKTQKQRRPQLPKGVLSLDW